MNNTTQMYGISQSRIAQLIIAETGTYNQQYRRPYESHLNGQGRQRLIEAFANTNAIVGSTFTGLAHQFIQPSAAPEANIVIANGWDTPRLRFMMEVQHLDRMGCQHSEYVIGYTDHPGVSMGGHLDPRMVFTVNAINTTSNRITNSATMGSQVYQEVIDASSVIVNDQYNGLTAPGKLYGLRPEDVYAQIDNQELAAGLDNDPIVASCSLLTTSAMKSRRSNSIAPTYMANVLNAYLQTTRSDQNLPLKEINETARTSVKSASASDDRFMTFLRSKSQTGTNYQFTYGDLLMLDPNVETVKRVVPMKPEWRAGLHHSGQTAHWHGTDYTTLFATTLIQSLPGYMLNYNLAKVHIVSANVGMGGLPLTAWKRTPQSFATGTDLSAATASFIYRLENELLRDLTDNNTISYDIDASCDLMGDTFVRISLNGEPYSDFVVPSFCDSLMAPMVTSKNAVLDGIASDFGSLMSEISDGTVRGSPATSQSLGFL